MTPPFFADHFPVFIRLSSFQPVIQFLCLLGLDGWSRENSNLRTRLHSSVPSTNAQRSTLALTRVGIDVGTRVLYGLDQVTTNSHSLSGLSPCR